MKKRGLSDVVTTVLIILLVLAAVVIIWAFVRPAITEGSSKISSDIVTTSLSIQKNSVVITDDEAGTTGVDESRVELKVVRNAGGGEIVGYNIILEDENGKREVKKISVNDFKELETESVDSNDWSDKATIFGDLGKVVKVSVAPIVMSQAGKKIILNPTSSYNEGTGVTEENNAGQCVDTDSDGYGNPASDACTQSTLDCEDNNALINPGATDICSDSIDNNCDGQINEGCPVILTNGLIGYWKLESIAGGNSFVGEYGSNLKCITTSPNYCPLIGVGKVGNAARFDGTYDYIYSDNSNTYGSISSIQGTFLAWVNFDSISNSAGEVIMEAGSSSTTNYIGLRKKNTNMAVMRFSAGGVDTEASSSLSSGWHHYAGTWDSANNIIKLYVDGQFVTQSILPSSTSFSFTQFRIGSKGFGAYGVLLDGSVDEVMVYDRALSDAEISDIYEIQNS